MLDEHDRVVVADRGGEQALRVGGRRRHHDLQTSDVGEPRFERLRVLRRVAASRPTLGSHDERHARLSPEHEPVLRRLVHDLVDRQTGEVDVHELDDRPEACEGGPDARPDDPDLADRRLADAVGPELREQPGGHLERAAVLGDVLAHDQDPGIPLHLESERVTKRLGVELLGRRGLGHDG